MASMSGSTYVPAPPGPRSAGADVSGDLFDALVLSGRPQRRRWFGVHASLAAHVVMISAIVLVPLLWPSTAPEPHIVVGLAVYNPPPPPPPPLLQGSSMTKATPRVQKPETPVKEPDKTSLTAPVETPEPDKKEEEVEEQAGSPTGTPDGDVNGMESGVSGGVVGGVPGGVLGGCVGCTGDGPVMDFDQPPRLIKQVKPLYPQESFVKKIEGTVLVEILIDATGRVVRAKILQSIPSLDAAAIQTVQQWVFTPAMKQGRPVATLAHVPIRFQIL